MDSQLRPRCGGGAGQRTWSGIIALVALVAVVALAAQYSRPLLENKNATPALSALRDVRIASGTAPHSSEPAL